MWNLLLTLITFMTLTGFLLSYSATAEVLETRRKPLRSRPPNIVLINADDLGYGDLGATGSELINTPNIDKMASEGVLLTNFFASAPVCTPSRAGLLTGRYAIRAGLGVDVIFPGSKHGLPAEETTIAENLKEVGYNTAVIGKWHLGHYAEYWPTSQGFDYYFGLPYSNDMLPLALYRGTEKIEEPANQSTLTKRYTEEAVRFVEQNADAPFFLYLPHTFPHLPLYASDDFRRTSKAGIYGDTVEEIDWSVGEILSTLRRLDLDDDTLVLFTSDNGPWFEGCAARRGRKQATWDGGFHVPLIARWPGRIPEGAQSNGMAMNTDIFPTLVELAGAEVPDDRAIDGRNIWGLLQGEQKSPHEALLFFNSGVIGAVRTERWKLVLQPDNKLVPYIHGFLEGLVGERLSAAVAARLRSMHYVGPFDNMDYFLLFDLDTDPYERYSVAQNQPEALEYLCRLLHEARAEFDPLLKDNPPPPVLSQGRPQPLKDPPSLRLSALSKTGLLAFAAGGTAIVLYVLRRKKTGET